MENHQHKHHEDLINSIIKQYHPILEGSKQAIYIYLDDIHKICNKKFASLLGYNSPKEWAHNEDMLNDIVDDKNRNTLVSAYGKARETFSASSFNITWKGKNGKKIKTDVILVPIMHLDHLFVIHFIS